MLTKIKGICEGGQPFAPLKSGDWIIDEEGETMEFICYSSTGWSGEFRCTRSGPIYILPLAGLRPFRFESGPPVDMTEVIAKELPQP